MRTLFIYDQVLEQPIKFFVLDGDYSRLDRVYMNHAEGDGELMEELHHLIYDEDGQELVTMSEIFPYDEKFDTVVVCGFIP